MHAAKPGDVVAYLATVVDLVSDERIRWGMQTILDFEVSE